MLKKILVVLLIIFGLIQFYRPARNLAGQPQPNDISKMYAVPQNVQTILDKACYDCHSNNTKYPWYSEIQPIRFLLDDHIDEGKREVNYNEFKTFLPRRQYIKLEETITQVKEGEMPLSSYTLIHSNARLTDPEKQALMGWAQNIRDTLKTTYPADSLARPKRPQGAK